METQWQLSIPVTFGGTFLEMINCAIFIVSKTSNYPAMLVIKAKKIGVISPFENQLQFPIVLMPVNYHLIQLSGN